MNTGMGLSGDLESFPSPKSSVPSLKKNLMDASLFWLKIVYLLSAIEYFDTHESCQLIYDIGCPKKLPCLIKRCIWSNKGSLQHVNFRCILASLYEALSIRRFVYPSVHLCNTGKSRSRWSGIIRNQMKTNMRPWFFAISNFISLKSLNSIFTRSLIFPDHVQYNSDVQK